MKNKGQLYRSDNEFGTVFFYELPRHRWWMWVPFTFQVGTTVTSPFWLKVENTRVRKKQVKQSSKLEFLLIMGVAFDESAIK